MIPHAKTPEHRHAQVLFLVLTVVFGVASVVYAALPTMVGDGFRQMDMLLGGSDAGYPETQCRIWTALAAANVATLSLLSFRLLQDLEKNRALHEPLFFMKTTSAVLFLAWWLAMPGARSLLVSFATDLATGVAIWILPRRALRSLAAQR